MKKILVVDDDECLHELLGKVLNFMGYDSISAAIGKEGIQKAIAEKPDLIVLDIDLPDMDGRDAARALRSHPITRAIPILAFTGMAVRSDSKSFFEAGCNDYVQKPVTFQALRVKLQSLLDLRER